jgi:hypothetical protein
VLIRHSKKNQSRKYASREKEKRFFCVKSVVSTYFRLIRNMVLESNINGSTEEAVSSEFSVSSASPRP